MIVKSNFPKELVKDFKKLTVKPMKYNLIDFIDAFTVILSDETAKSVIVLCHPVKLAQTRIKITKMFKNEFRIICGELNAREKDRVYRLKKQGIKISRIWTVPFPKKRKSLRGIYTVGNPYTTFR